MRALTPQEKRTVRFGGLGLAVYLVLFFGMQTWKSAQTQRREYEGLLRDAKAFQEKLALYQDKAEVAKSLMEELRMDPAQFAVTSIVARASAALQQAAMGGGVMLGPIRETPSRTPGRELTSIQIEGMGPVPAMLGFLHKMSSLGFPLLTDSLQITAQPMGPGMLKLNATLQILDFDHWKPEERRPDA